MTPGSTFTVHVILASTRQGRSGGAVAEWAMRQVRAHGRFEAELIDLAEVDLPHLVHEWAYKPMGFVAYGGVSAGTRAVSGAKQTAVALRMMPMVEAVTIPFFTHHIDETTGEFDPGELQARAAQVMLDELHRWTGALSALRAPR